MPEISREFNVDMNDWRTYEAASQLMIATVGLLKEYNFPDQLQLNCMPHRGVHRFDNSLRAPEGHTPTFVATETQQNIYRVQAELPLPVAVQSGRGINSATYRLQLPHMDTRAGGIIEIEGNVERRGKVRYPMSAATVLNGLTQTLDELHRKRLPIFGYRTSFRPVNYNETGRSDNSS